jgi:hypothetical protein
MILIVAGWREDCEKHHQATIEAVKSTANEQVSFNVQGVSMSLRKQLIYLEHILAVSR